MRTDALFILIVAFVCFGCGEDGDDGFDFPLEGKDISMNDIVGDWAATKAEFSTSDGLVLYYDVVAEGGQVLMNISADGRFVMNIDPLNLPSERISGQLGFDVDILAVQFDEDPDDWIYLGINHDEPELQLAGGPLEEAFDFDGDGIQDPAYIDFLFIRD